MKAIVTLSLALVLGFASAVVAAELKSGLQPGDLVPAFDVEKCGGAVNDGRSVGDNFCYRCMLGNKPVVMVFARKSDDKLASLAKALDKHVAANADQKLSSFINLIGENPAELKAEAKDFAAKNKLENVAHYIEKKNIKGARRLFVLSFFKDDVAKLMFYDPMTASMEPPNSLDELNAVYVAAAPWSLMAQKAEMLNTIALAVDEHDLDNRIIINPIVDESYYLVGLAGLFIDEDFFKETLLPRIVDEALPAFFSKEERSQVYVEAQKERKPDPDQKEEADLVRRPLNWIFTDYDLSLCTEEMSPQKWAQSNFLLNITMSAAIALVLLAGVTLALRTASREVRLSQMKNDFVSNVSHELRTPLASIRVFAELMRLGRVEGGDKVREYGEYIETESRRLTGLVNNILDFARIESGRKTYSFEMADLQQLVADTLRTFEVRLRHDGFQIELSQPGEALPQVLVDSTAMAQALSNLLDNAVKYSGDARRINVSLRRDGPWAVISVKDQGVGIPASEQQKVFERFHRVSTGLVHDVKGSGLGLSIVSHIVTAHHGRVTVESAPGRGSTFSIRLPIPPGSPAAAPEAAHAT